MRRWRATRMRRRCARESPGSPARAGWQAAIELDDVRAGSRRPLQHRRRPARSPGHRRPGGHEPQPRGAGVQAQGLRPALGRQRLTLDDQRFVGNVGWRQNEQTARWRGAALATAREDRADARLDRQRQPHLRARRGNAGRVLARRQLAAARQARPRQGWNAGGVLLRLDFEGLARELQRDAGIRLARQGGRRRRLEPAVGGVVRIAARPRPQSRRLLGPLPPARARARARTRDAQARPGTAGGDASRAGHRLLTPLATLHAFQGWADSSWSRPTGRRRPLCDARGGVARPEGGGLVPRLRRRALARDYG